MMRYKREVVVRNHLNQTHKQQIIPLCSLNLSSPTPSTNGLQRQHSLCSAQRKRVERKWITTLQTAAPTGLHDKSCWSWLHRDRISRNILNQHRPAGGPDTDVGTTCSHTWWSDALVPLFLSPLTIYLYIHWHVFMSYIHYICISAVRSTQNSYFTN